MKLLSRLLAAFALIALCGLGLWIRGAGERANWREYWKEWHQHTASDGRFQYMLLHQELVKTKVAAWRKESGDLSLYEYLLKSDPKWRDLSQKAGNPVSEKAIIYAAERKPWHLF